MVIAVIPEGAIERVSRSLSRSRISYTEIASTGSFLEVGNTTLLIGVARTQVSELLRLIRAQGPDQGIAFVLKAQAGENGVVAFPGVLEMPGRR